MGGTRTGTRRRSVCAALVALALVGTLASPGAKATDGHPPRSHATTDSFGDPSLQVEEVTVRGRSGYALLCVSAEAVARLDESTRAVTRQEGCSDSIDYRFDPIAWTASVDGAFVISTTTTRQRLVGGHWTPISVDRALGAVVIDLRWLGTGGATAEPRVSPPRVCYTFLPSVCGGPHVGSIERDADVSGRIDFEAFGRSAVVPVGHGGTLGLS